ncbi:hypothetical protein QP028_11110 [Corynebacterium suedekumii]|nr:hypothetical protein QP028_11110 [Corynebacterium suedekumii]
MQARDAGERRKRQQLEERERIAQENARARDALANRRSWREIVAETKNSTDGREESAA